MDAYGGCGAYDYAWGNNTNLEEENEYLHKKIKKSFELVDNLHEEIDRLSFQSANVKLLSMGFAQWCVDNRWTQLYLSASKEWKQLGSDNKKTLSELFEMFINDCLKGNVNSKTKKPANAKDKTKTKKQGIDHSRWVSKKMSLKLSK